MPSLIDSSRSNVNDSREREREREGERKREEEKKRNKEKHFYFTRFVVGTFVRRCIHFFFFFASYAAQAPLRRQAQDYRSLIKIYHDRDPI